MGDEADLGVAIRKWIIRIAFIVVAFTILLLIFGALWKVLLAIGLYFFGTVAPPEKAYGWFCIIGKAIGKLLKKK